jgi:peroxiredoxin
MDFYNYEAYGQCEVGAPDFRSVAKVGMRAPNFTLASLDGKPVSLTDFLGKKHILLEFGSIYLTALCEGGSSTNQALQQV